VSRFIEPQLILASEQILIDHRDQDPKSRLQELVQAQGFGPPLYRTCAANGPEHRKTFDVEVLVNQKVVGSGSGLSKQAAAKAAARDALERLEFGTDFDLENL
jgi:ribonuclease III